MVATVLAMLAGVGWLETFDRHLRLKFGKTIASELTQMLCLCQYWGVLKLPSSARKRQAY